MKGITKRVTLTVTRFLAAPHPIQKKDTIGADAYTIRNHPSGVGNPPLVPASPEARGHQQANAKADQPVLVHHERKSRAYSTSDCPPPASASKALS